MKRKDIEQAIRAELDRHPGVAYDFVHRGRHPAVVLSSGGNSRFVTYSGTTTELRAVRNKLCDLRRAVREITSA